MPTNDFNEMPAAAGLSGGRTERDIRSGAAEHVETAASAVRDAAADLPGGRRVREFAQATADRMSSTADYVRSHDLNDVMADVQSLVTRHPGPALAAAAIVGFVVARSLSRD
jgi:ElaB/YqjD/DUF883 family membrane-anchored ribosome-binding protein